MDRQVDNTLGKVDRSLSIEEAAERLGYSERTIRRRIKDGSLQAFQQAIPQGFEWRILLEEEPAEEDTEGRQASGKLDSPDRQEARQTAGEGRQEPDQVDTGAEEPADQPEEAPDSVHVAPAEPGLLKALEMIETLQREHRQEVNRLQQEKQELYGRAAYFQAKLQDAEERILMLEAQPAEEEQQGEPEKAPKKPSGSWWRRLLGRAKK